MDANDERECVFRFQVCEILLHDTQKGLNIRQLLFTQVNSRLLAKNTTYGGYIINK